MAPPRYGIALADARGPAAPVIQCKKVQLPGKEEPIETDEYLLDELIELQVGLAREKESSEGSAAYLALDEEIVRQRNARLELASGLPELGRTGFYKAIAPMFRGAREKYCLKRYGEHGVTVLESLSKLAGLFKNEVYLDLMCDPGLCGPSQLGGFLEFVTTTLAGVEDAPAVDPWKLRDTYARSLTPVEVFRALDLTDEEAQVLAKEGNYAKTIREARGPGGRDYAAAIGRGELEQGELFDKPIASVIRERQVGRTSHFFDDETVAKSEEGSLSITEEPDIAVAVAASMHGESSQKEIFTLHSALSPVDIIRPEDYGINLAQHVRRPDEDSRQVRGNKLESFVLGGLDADEFKLRKEKGPYPKLTSY
jgi:hypothetical protein